MAAKKLDNRENGNIERVQQLLQGQTIYTLNRCEFPLILQFQKLHIQQGNKINDKDIHQILKHALRSLYVNLDLLQEKWQPIVFIRDISIKPPIRSFFYFNNGSDFSERVHKIWSPTSNTIEQYVKVEKRYVVINKSPMSLEMADSINHLETITSENNLDVDLEESQLPSYTSTIDATLSTSITRTDHESNVPAIDSKHDDTITTYGDSRRTKDLHKIALMDYVVNDSSATSSSMNSQHEYSSGSSIENPNKKVTLHNDEITKYENEVLNDPFYESDCGSEGGNETSESVPKDNDECKEKVLEKLEDEEVHDNCTQVENSCAEKVQHKLTDFTRSSACSNSNISNHYFIDASSLNDEVEILNINVKEDVQTGTNASRPYMSVSADFSQTLQSHDTATDQFYKFTCPFKVTNIQKNECNKIAEFEPEMKITKYFQPVVDIPKITKINSTLIGKDDGNKGTNKESLAVEIKEADSGESNHASPCPDNSTNINNSQDKIDVNSDIKNDENNVLLNITTKDSTDSKETNKNTTENAQQPLLIRRNTFELDSNDKLSVLRQEYERRQGNLVFQSAIPQYSGHRVDSDMISNPTTDSTTVVPINDVLNNFTPDIKVATNIQQYHSGYLSLDSYESKIDPNLLENNYLLQNSITNSDTSYSSSADKTTDDKLTFQCYEDDDSAYKSSSSLPVTVGCNIENVKLVDVIRKTKRNETAPIISGGVSTSDFTKPMDSPIVKRKTESTPIVSGGSVIMDDTKDKQPSRMSSSMTAWVVDMSDCTKSESGSTTRDSSMTNMSQSFSTPECIKNSIRSSSHEKHGSLGFFVNLNNVESKEDDTPTEENVECKKVEPPKSDKAAYCEFYIDISNKNDLPKNKKVVKEDTNHKNVEEVDKKNIFSMFIDLGDPQKTTESVPPPKTMHKRNLSSFTDKRIEEKIDEVATNENSTTLQENQDSHSSKSIKEKPKRGVFMFIESDSPIVRRRTLSSSRSVLKRHSWNIDKTQSANGNGQTPNKESIIKKEHKRAHSLSVDQRDLKKMQTKQSSSSHSLSDAAGGGESSTNNKNSNSLHELESNSNNNMDTSTEECLAYDIKDTPPNSHIEIIDKELRASIKYQQYKELGNDSREQPLDDDTKIYEDEYSDMSGWGKTCTESTNGQTRKSETFDISSGSGPSPNSDNRDYELSDLLSRDVETTVNIHPIIPSTGNKILETHKSLNETIKKIECELEGPDYVKPDWTYNNHTSVSKVDKNNHISHDVKDLQLNKKKPSSKFVRLSDLTETSGHSHTSDYLMPKENRAVYRMSSSIPETSWIESKLVMSRTNDSVRTLSRVFSSVMSTSLPSKQKSPLEELTRDGEAEGIISESDISSMQSSMGRSGADGSTEETETSSLAGGKPHNRLGEDLLRMFSEEINTDVTIDVSGERIRAHKCILSSRCQYFAAILSGGWIESAGNVISLQGYSYNAVNFALRHIYSGESNIPDSISIVELATLADMLCLEGLKEVIGYTIKVKYCHSFHKPCQVCAVGVLECMPLAAAYGLDEIYRKSLRWVTRHFVRIWPCKAFATLPRELMEKCYLQHIVHMSTDNVLQTMMDCDKLLATLPNVRWAEPVYRMVSNLLETTLKFLSDNFAAILNNENFQSLGRDLTWNISRLEDNFLSAAERLPPEQACKSYSRLHKMLLPLQTDNFQTKLKWGPLFIEFLKKIQARVEKCLVREAARAARSTTWLKMDLELRRRIQELACLVILPHETSKCQSRHSNFLKVKDSKTSSGCSVSRNLDLKRVKMAISEHNDKTMKQMPSIQQTRKVLNKPKSDPVERKLQEDNKPSTSDAPSRPKSWPNKIEVKSRYLEPRTKFVPKENATVNQDKVIIQRRKITISSSDSSRTSSPATKRVTEKKPIARVKLPVKKDVKALSSDSLTESNITRPNKKKNVISKSCGITRPESPSFKQKSTEIGLSVDSLAESKNKPTIAKKNVNKMDTSMSTDSLMTEITSNPKSNTLQKLSPTLGKNINKTQIYDRTKKNMSPMQQKNPVPITRRPPRSLENSTAASRSRAAAINAYHGSPNLRRNLLDAAKTPDISSKSINNVPSRIMNMRQTVQSTAMVNSIVKREKKDNSANQQQGSDNSSRKSSPKSGTNRPNKPILVNKKLSSKINDDKIKTKCHTEETPKQLTVGSRSGTFLKDEPTILKKTDIKSSQIST
ncbi:PREDICTED: uncharacterized protein LOC107065377 isoform X3 [Polistes dominula]|uniref:Uncharacterized protein LOC107065377 isoform X3 n=1 Tax=Polistes dominula TaxID=743375 RepID=A0ABM1I2Q8_POLDO|nr:PREDICTED: uncharacterized protein LOC107065377 isoform X3 [Polistes dominula]